MKVGKRLTAFFLAVMLILTSNELVLPKKLRQINSRKKQKVPIF